MPYVEWVLLSGTEGILRLNIAASVEYILHEEKLGKSKQRGQK